MGVKELQSLRVDISCFKDPGVADSSEVEHVLEHTLSSELCSLKGSKLPPIMTAERCLESGFL